MLRSAIIVAAVLGVVRTAASQEKEIKRTDLPAAVERTVAARSEGGTVHGLSVEREKGRTYYEAEMTVQGHRRDVLIDEAGTVVEVEEEVALDALPQAVRDALTAKAGVGKITMVESLTKSGRLVAYEAHLVTEGKKSEIQVGPDGKPLDHEE